MPASPLPDIEPREVVSVEAAESMLLELRREIAQLEDELRRIGIAAEEAEGRAEQGSLHSPFALRSLTSTSDFIAQMHAQNREEMQRAFEVAEANAAERVTEAEAEAGALLVGARGAAPDSSVVDLTDVSAAVEVVTAPEAAIVITEAPTVEPDVPAAVEAVEADVTSVGVEMIAADDELLGSEEAYEKFWREEAEVTKARSASFAPLEALLPILALIVLLCVVLILVG
jgi:hypothetical protein